MTKKDLDLNPPRSKQVDRTLFNKSGKIVSAASQMEKRQRDRSSQGWSELDSLPNSEKTAKGTFLKTEKQPHQ